MPAINWVLISVVGYIRLQERIPLDKLLHLLREFETVDVGSLLKKFAR